MSRARTTFSVIVPTCGRPELLVRCLEGLANQTRPALEVIVVRPDDDEESASVIDRCRDVTEVTISERSNMAGLDAGSAIARGDVVCLIDDDAVPRPDWLERMSEHFDDDRIGAVGGPDRQPGALPEPGLPVGLITTWGKLVGNHHLGDGAARDVHVLKGVNMAFRKELFAVPLGLRGGRTQDHFEVAMSLWVRRHGVRVVYDPRVVVDHFPAARVDGTRRFSTDHGLARSSAFNLVYSIVSMDRAMAVRRALFGLLIGDRGCPGILRAIIALAQGDPTVIRRLVPSLRGQVEALAEIGRGRPLDMRPLAQASQEWAGPRMDDLARDAQ